MRNIWIIARKEYKHYFISPTAYAVAFMILLILGIIFYVNILAAVMQQYAPSIQLVLNPLVTLLLFTTPAITMRSLAEEQKSGTLELLLTAPIRDWELVVGKWLGGLLFVASILAVTLIYALVLNQLISPGIDFGVVLTGYLGLLLLVGTFIAIGVAVSSLFSNQIAAFFATLGILLALWMIGIPSQIMGAGGSAVIQYVDLSAHYYDTFYQGIIDLKDVVYYLSAIALLLFAGSVSLESRRWR